MASPENSIIPTLVPIGNKSIKSLASFLAASSRFGTTSTVDMLLEVSIAITYENAEVSVLNEIAVPVKAKINKIKIKRFAYNARKFLEKNSIS